MVRVVLISLAAAAYIAESMWMRFRH